MYRRLVTIILFVAAFLSAPVFSPKTYAQTYNKYEESYNFKRTVEALRNDDDSKAISYLDKEISLHKDNTNAYLLLQNIYNNRKQYGEALTTASKALKYMPKKTKKIQTYIS